MDASKEPSQYDLFTEEQKKLFNALGQLPIDGHSSYGGKLDTVKAIQKMIDKAVHAALKEKK
jgi:hypothetical protein